MEQLHSPLPDPASIPLVELESMNATHREEVELVNRLGDLLMGYRSGGVAEAELTATVKGWVEHTREHFERENRLMLEYGFPAYQMHSSEHERILGLLETLQREWLNSRSVEPLAGFLFETWPGWFETHVCTMDRVTAQFVSQRDGQ